MVEWLKSIKRSFLEIPKQPALLVNGFLVFVLAAFIGLLYYQGTVSKIPLGVLDLDQSELSRRVVTYFDQDEKFSPSYFNSYGDLQTAIIEQEVQGALIIANDFNSKIKKGQQGDLLLAYDGTNYITANSLKSRAASILASVNAGISIQLMEGKNLLPAESLFLAGPFQIQQKLLYNDTFHYLYYLGYGVFGAGVFSLLMSAIGVTLTRRKIKLGIPAKKELAANLLAYGFYAALLCNLVFWFNGWLFKMPLRGEICSFFFLTLPFGLLIALWGWLMHRAAFYETRIYQLSAFVATSLFFLSGFTWPLSNIPNLLLPFYYLSPLTSFMNGARAAFVMGSNNLGLYFVWTAALVLFYGGLIWGLTYLKKEKEFKRRSIKKIKAFSQDLHKKSIDEK